MSIELAVPFSLDPSGSLAITSDPVAQAQQHIDSLISTTPGERAMQPAYGVDLTGQVFTPDTGDLSAHVQLDIHQAFNRWEPGVQLSRVSPSQSSDSMTGVIALDVDWTIPGQTSAASQTGVSQATMMLGGTVIDDQQVS